MKQLKQFIMNIVEALKDANQMRANSKVKYPYVK